MNSRVPPQDHTAHRRLIWTRAREDWPKDDTILAHRGPRHTVLHIPCLELSSLPIDHGALAGARFDFVVFTSANAVRFAAREAALRTAIDQATMVYTQGPQTYIELNTQGIRSTLIEDAPTGAELCVRLGALLPKGARVLVLNAAEPAYDLATGLTNYGLQVVRLACYRTETGARREDGTPLAKAEVERWTATVSGVICFASPSAVRGFDAVFAASQNRLRAALAAATIGPTTADAARAVFDVVEETPTATIAALADLGYQMLRSR